MPSPYASKPDHQFWRRSVVGRPATDVDLVVAPDWRIGPDARIATAGSCFAQHIARTLSREGYGYLVTEREPAFPFSGTEQYGLFTARYGNIYTVRQLRQLFDRAYGMFAPQAVAWRRDDGRFVDPFRPNVNPDGFASIDEVTADRTAHLAAVRSMFETCDVFIFTLGLTEAWTSTIDEAVFPLAPGVVSGEAQTREIAFANFGVTEMLTDFRHFIHSLHGINPSVRIILTVSPVPLAATFESQHVLTATAYSKAALRVVAEEACREHDLVTYFPSFEMITGPHSRGAFWAEDLREVRPEGVSYVMGHFMKHYLASREPARTSSPSSSHRDQAQVAEVRRYTAEMEALGQIVCDEDLIEGRV